MTGARFKPYVTRNPYGFERRCVRCREIKPVGDFDPGDLFCTDCATEADRVSLDEQPKMRQVSDIGPATRPLPRPLPRVIPSRREFLESR